MHGFGLARRVEQISRGVFKVNSGSFLTALQGLEPAVCLIPSGGRRKTRAAPSSICSRVQLPRLCFSRLAIHHVTGDGSSRVDLGQLGGKSMFGNIILIELERPSRFPGMRS